ncbi:tyrosine lyase ThiH [Chitinophaga costaii]|uniref:Tyrosine lyase ThiH n=1 Tax=Chitinophaga costaii TaxID=1335309 RepID=A0A1C4FLZ5_9BACT|nr:2-iminoacetate synthase ThiH [Chitinophaga costaii]PUZ29956.1 2-iminoacetate synthase ThiH [Chitinophaga costaii]SCC56912.1 tyrosine lyase ThiH [Chitinophaga costaii]
MFSDIFHTHDWDAVRESIYSKTSHDVERALQRTQRTLEDFKALIAPAALPYLETMARKSQALTRQRFGKTIQLYVPLYLSNVCQNICTYCAFSMDNLIPRKTLTDAEILEEVAVLKAMGYEHVLLVTGEASQQVGVAYLQNAIRLIKPYFANISLEVQPLQEAEYALLIKEGLHTVLVYQETYRAANYKQYHPKGRKSNFEYRLATPDRLGKAGIHKIGLGTLIGLEDWRTDACFTALHLQYLEQTYWQTRYSISFPRLRPIAQAEGSKSFAHFMEDAELVQLICAYRLFRDDLEIAMSTREQETFRDHAVQLGITSMSAGSKTNPGGYAVAPQSLEQFEISDERSPAVIADMIRAQGYEPVWKDWDQTLL